jgi:catechol 2,3-dioxygenase-like lactoylglutathione lyase family enzyme
MLIINHLNLPVRNIQRSFEFYVGRLGFKYVRHLKDTKIFLEHEGFDIFLEECAEVEPHPRFHFGLKTTVEGVHEFAEKLRASGVELGMGNNPYSEIYVTTDRARTVFYFSDPDGHIIEVYSHIGNEGSVR